MDALLRISCQYESIDINSGLGLTRLTLTVLYSGLMFGNTGPLRTGGGSNSACFATGFLVDLRLRVVVMFEHKPDSVSGNS